VQGADTTESNPPASADGVNTCPIGSRPRQREDSGRPSSPTHAPLRRARWRSATLGVAHPRSS